VVTGGVIFTGQQPSTSAMAWAKARGCSDIRLVPRVA
jgi:hypothetical protein